MQINQVLIAPVVTEKATQMAQKNTYTFKVAQQATKDQVTSVVEKLYQVKVAKVRMTIRKGKVRRVGKRMYPVQESNTKIAYISVKEGTIPLFPKA